MNLNYKAFSLLITVAIIAFNICIGQVQVRFSSRQSPNIGAVLSNEHIQMYLVSEEDTLFLSKINDTTFLLDLESLRVLSSIGDKYFNVVGCNFCAFVPIDLEEINNSKLVEIRLFRKIKNRVAIVRYCQQECVDIFYPKVVSYKRKSSP